jgi:hypothetical protein
VHSDFGIYKVIVIHELQEDPAMYQPRTVGGTAWLGAVLRQVAARLPGAAWPLTTRSHRARTQGMTR